MKLFAFFIILFVSFSLSGAANLPVLREKRIGYFSGDGVFGGGAHRIYGGHVGYSDPHGSFGHAYGKGHRPGTYYNQRHRH